MKILNWKKLTENIMIFIKLAHEKLIDKYKWTYILFYLYLYKYFDYLEENMTLKWK